MIYLNTAVDMGPDFQVRNHFLRHWMHFSILFQLSASHHFWIIWSHYVFESFVFFPMEFYRNVTWPQYSGNSPVCLDMGLFSFSVRSNPWAFSMLTSASVMEICWCYSVHKFLPSCPALLSVWKNNFSDVGPLAQGSNYPDFSLLLTSLCLLSCLYFLKDNLNFCFWQIHCFIFC